MKYLHTMIRVKDLDASLRFYVELLDLKVTRKKDYEKGAFSLVFLSDGISDSEIELTYNWGQSEAYSVGRNFGHLAFAVDDIYETCQKLMDAGIPILRPPRDGRMAFVKCPDQISIELLQKGEALEAKAPWLDMPNQGEW